MRIPFTLDRPLVFLDLETTGIDVARDRIVELAATHAPADPRLAGSSYSVRTWKKLDFGAFLQNAKFLRPVSVMRFFSLFSRGVLPKRSLSWRLQG